MVCFPPVKQQWMMVNQTLYISFNGYTLGVTSSDTELFDTIQNSFKALLSNGEKKVIGSLLLHANEHGFIIEGAHKTDCRQGSLEQILSYLKLEIVYRFIDHFNRLMWFHAGGAVFNNHAVILMGSLGMGKSTLTTSLVAEGWLYLSDDVVPMSVDPIMAFAFPQTPRVRINPGKEVDRPIVYCLEKHEMMIGPHQICKTKVPVGALIFPQYNFHARTELLPFSPSLAALEVIQHCLNFKRRQSKAVAQACEVVSCLPCYRLPFNDSQKATALILEAEKNGFSNAQ